MTISLEEHVARAIRHASCETPTYPWTVWRQDEAEANIQEWCKYAARAAIAAVREREGTTIDAMTEAELSGRLDRLLAPDPAEAMRAKWEKLERATQPFRSVFETYPADRFPDSEIVSIKVTFGDLRELAAALKGKGER